MLNINWNLNTIVLQGGNNIEKLWDLAVGFSETVNIP